MSTYIGPENRCAECGGLATRQNPDEADIVGCDMCFPHWPLKPETVVVKGQTIRYARLDAEGQVVTAEEYVSNDPDRRLTMEFSIGEVDPEVFDIMTGGVLSRTPADPTFSIEVVTKVKRPWWRRLLRWLRRKPPEYRTIYIPSARIDRLD